MTPQTPKERIAKGNIAAGLVVVHSRTPAIAHMAASCGFQWLFMDLEHGSTSLQTTSEICTAALTAGIAPFVRVPENAPAWIGRALDGGAIGVVVPHVESAADAKLAVDAARYPPLGTRSLSGLLPQLDYRVLSATEQMQQADAMTFLVALIETQQGLNRVDEIAAIPGIDALQIGTSDLSVSLGVPGELDHALVQDAVRRTIAVCKQEKKIPIVGGAYRPDWLKRYIGMGARMLLVGNDQSLLINAFRERTAFVASLLS
jgi:2-keto-3-deoxy-L-rhamnonate aldolase RhmA